MQVQLFVTLPCAAAQGYGLEDANSWGVSYLAKLEAPPVHLMDLLELVPLRFAQVLRLGVALLCGVCDRLPRRVEHQDIAVEKAAPHTRTIRRRRYLCRAICRKQVISMN